jgi:hypothetical protein
MSTFTQSWQGAVTNSQHERLVNENDDDFVADWWAPAEAEEPNENLAPTLNIPRLEGDFVDLEFDHPTEIGQNSREWHKVMKSFKSRKMYVDRLQDFVEYATVNPSDLTLIQKLCRYFEL